MNLDAYMDDFGRDLEHAAQTRRRRRRRLALRLAPVLPVAGALALALTLLPGGGGSVDAIAAARAALAPNGEIVHMKVEMGIGDRGGMPPVEQWYAAGPDRWRTRTESLKIRGKGRVRPVQFETAFSNDRMRFYDQRRDVVTIWRNDKARGQMGPSLLGGDPASDLREQLGKGDVRDDGVVTVDGRKVRRLVRDLQTRGYKQRFVYYMDPDTFAPVAGHLNIERPDGKRFRGPQFKVVLYERLPLNEETEQLLKFKKTADTKYVWR
jgi:hypothetical protein